MIDSSADPLQIQIQRTRQLQQWQAEAEQLRAAGYASGREAREHQATLAVQDALKRAAAGDPSAAWGNTYNDPPPGQALSTSTSPNAPNPMLNLTFGTKFGIAVACLLVIGLLWVRERMNKQ